MTRRIFTACFGTETNSFSPIPTGMPMFQQTMLVRGGRHGERLGLFAVPLVRWKRQAEALGWTVAEGLACFATPAGNTTEATHRALRDEILADLRSAMPVDAVLLNLHGAMIADGDPDAEGDLLARVRAMVGPDVPIGAELDLHCHLTRQKVSNADALVIYKHYPHIDVAERADELFSLMHRMLDGLVRPTMAVYDCAMLGAFPTTAEPMASLVARMTALEVEPGVLSVSLAHGFPWGDTPEVGTRVLVVTDNDAVLAARHASELGESVWTMREAIVPPFLSIDQAIDKLLAAGDHDGRPFVMADTADNPGIGAAGDSTFMLRRLIERGVGGVALSPLWDPMATALAFNAGVGARMDLRIGGKLGPASGAALDLRVTVMALTPEAWQPFGGAMAPLGRMAWLRMSDLGGAEAIDIVVNDHRTQSFHPDCFRAVGIDTQTPRALVVKSTQHFHAGFAPIAREVLYISAPGSGSMDLATLPHRLVQRELWPRVASPKRGIVDMYPT